MLDLDRIDNSEEIDLAKRFKFQLYVCSGCHDND